MRLPLGPQRSVDVVVRDWLEERLPARDAASDREVVREALRTTSMLTELGPYMKQRAARSTATLDDVRAALDRAGGKPLSETILNMRGPKE